MDIKIFLFLLSFFSVLNNSIVEVTKKICKELNIKYSCNLIAIIEGLIIGLVGTISYFVLNNVQITSQLIVFAILMGGATALSSMQSYDKVAQLISQLEK